MTAVRGSHPLRAWQRYSEARGNTLAGGIAYFAFFSIFPALAVGLTVVGFVMRAQSDVLDSVIGGLEPYLPGLIHRGAEPADPAAREPGIYIDAVLQSSALNLALFGSLAVLLFTGLGWIDAMRQGIRAVFGEEAGGAAFPIAKARDLVVLLVIGSGVVLSILSVTVTATAGDWLLRQAGVEDTTVGAWLLRLAGLLVALVVDSATFLAVFRVLPMVSVPLRQLVPGALIGGVGLGVLKQFGTEIASRSASNNAFLGAAASIVVLLVLMNLVGRLILLAAAWAATQAEDAGSLPARWVEDRYVVPLGPVEPPQLRRGTGGARGGRAAAFGAGLAGGALAGAGATLVLAVRVLGGRPPWSRRARRSRLRG